MDKLIFGLTVALIGMMIVFFGLVILIGLIKTLGYVTTPKQKKTVKQEVTSVETTNTVVEEIPAQEDDGAIVAAISAAIAAILGEGNGFTVKHIKRIAK